MLSALIRFAIARRGVVMALAALLLLFGGYRLNSAGLDIFPEFAPHQVIIQTEAPGLAAEQVEIGVTQRIEQALGGLMGLKQIRSESIQGLSVVTVVFGDATDLYRARQMVGERLTQLAAALPEDTGPPVLTPLASSSATVLTLGLTSATRNPMDLRGLADWTLAPRLLAVSGVADVNVFGGAVRQLQIQVHPDKLKRHGLGLNSVLEAARQAVGPQGAGFIENANQRFSVRVVAQPDAVEALRRVVLARKDGASITLGDVATVADGPEPPISAAQIGGQPGVVLMVIGQYGANTLSVSRQVESVLDELRPVFEKQGVTLHPPLFRPADYIETSIRNLGGHLLLGSLFVVAVLYGFLYNLRTAFISALAIPLSLLAAALALLEMGANLNIMALGGLAIALGEVVDDAIIDTENIFRRLRENRRAASPRGQEPASPPLEKGGRGDFSSNPARQDWEIPPNPPLGKGGTGPGSWVGIQRLRSTAEVVFDASLEVRGSVVYASFIVALVFVPLLGLSGVAGRLFAPLGVSYILAILMSLGVALTVTPALCYLLLGSNGKNGGWGESANPNIPGQADPLGFLPSPQPTADGNPDDDSPLLRWLKPRYRRILSAVFARPRTVILGSLGVCGAALAVLPFLGGQFLPQLREGHYIVHTSALPGTALAESIRSGTQLTDAFLTIPSVRSASQWAGRAERGADTYGSHYSEYEVRLNPLSGKEQQDVLDRLRAVLRSFPGLLFEANTFLTERVDETISGYTAPVVINLYGPDLDVLDQTAQRVADQLRRIPGATDVQLRSPPGTATVDVRLRPDRLAAWGLRPGTALEALSASFGGVTVGQRQEGNRAFDVTVLLDPALRQSPDSPAELPLKNAEGVLVTLGQVADIRQDEGRYNILHRDARRVQSVTCNVAGGDVVSFLDEARARIVRKVAFPPETYPEFTGAAVEQAQAREELILQSLLAGTGVLLLTHIAIGRLRNTLLTLVNLPFSLAGGVLAALLTGGVLSVGSLVGFVTLFGITVRNAIMLISHYRRLTEEEGLAWNRDTALKGAEERLPSILMTALVTALAMLPIAINSDNPGREIMGPMAAIIVGGLISSTALNLLVLPGLLLRYGRFGLERETGE